VDGRFVCEFVNHIVVATLQGEPTKRILEACQVEVLAVVRGSGMRAVLYDFRQLSQGPSAKVLLHQEALDHETNGLKLRRAVVVSNSAVGYLARLAFSADGSFIIDRHAPSRPKMTSSRQESDCRSVIGCLVFLNPWRIWLKRLKA
jgi:hypothetical protein